MRIANELNAAAGDELLGAIEAVVGGDEGAARLAGEIRKVVEHVNRASRGALDKADKLHGDDTMYPAGRERQVAAIPGELHHATEDQLQHAELQLDLLEGSHLAALLHHDSRNDFALVNELQNYTLNLKQHKAVAEIVRLAGNPRYSTLLAGPYGDSLAARFDFKAEILRKVALEALAVDGTETQRRRSAALAAIPAARRVVALARAGRDTVAQEAVRPRAPRPSQAMMS